jgi:hypothetical protein
MFININNKMTNDMTGSHGRLCNHIIRAHVASFIAKTRYMEYNYGEYYDKMVALGIKLYTEGTKTYKASQQIRESELMSYINVNYPITRNIELNTDYYQTKEFSNYLYKYYKTPENQSSIIEANKFKSRYNNNNDVYVHVRLGDVEHKNPGFAYYDKALSQLSFEKGYISSDTIDHEICKKLIYKYGLIPIEYDEVETIMFGSTCKNIILSNGSFSYIIGLFGFFSKIYYIQNITWWCPPELFFIDDWTEISI